MAEVIDLWFVTKLEQVLQWLLDWFGITQSQIEKATIAVGTIGFFLANMDWWLTSKLLAWHIFIVCVVCYGLWLLHRLTASRRQHELVSSYRRVFRLSYVALTSFLLLPLLANKDLATLGLWIACYSFSFMLYLICCNVSGEKGKKAKLSLAKLKELFGDLEWLPQN